MENTWNLDAILERARAHQAQQLSEWKSQLCTTLQEGPDEVDATEVVLEIARNSTKNLIGVLSQKSPLQYVHTDHFYRLAVVLDQHFGECLKEVTTALYQHALRREGKGEETEKKPFEVFAADYQVSQEEAEEALMVICGEGVCEEIIEKTILNALLDNEDLKDEELSMSTIEEQLNAFREILISKEDTRKKVLEILYHHTLLPYQKKAAILTQEGFKTLSKIKEITDAEHYGRVKDSLTYRAKFYQKDQQSLAQKEDEEDIKKVEALQNLALSELAEAQDLVEKINCARHKQELDALRENEYNLMAVEHKKKEIIQHVMRELSRYNMRIQKEKSGEEEAYLNGLPIRIVDTKEGSCFGGVWLTAMLLKESGFKDNELFYGNGLILADGTVSAHGTLLVKGFNYGGEKEITLVDHGLNGVGRFNEAFVKDSERRTDLYEIMRGHRTAPVTLKTDSDLAYVLQQPQHLQVLPLLEGLTYINVYHNGIKLFQEEKYEAASFAFDLALSFNPKDPNIRYYRGMIDFLENRYDEAEYHFRTALLELHCHIPTLLAYGELYYAKGDRKKALVYFQRMNEVEYFSGEEQFVEKAKEWIKFLS